jgi:hypothetical protein
MEARLMFGNSKQLLITLPLRGRQPDMMTDRLRVRATRIFILICDCVYLIVGLDRTIEITKACAGVDLPA